MRQAKHGDTVKIHYTGKLEEDGTVFDHTLNGDPLLFTIGRGQIIPGIEQAVIGMNPGESKTTYVQPDKAFGSYYEEYVLEMDRNELPEELGEPKAGQQLELGEADGQMVQVTVTGVSDSSVTLDANHPLAGKDLTFDIELVEIV
ncbi:MAG: peptidylprolyl isomerase [Candidatus Binatia bacterium]